MCDTNVNKLKSDQNQAILFQQNRQSIKFSMDKGLYTGLVMIDLQKAFDTVNHAIMSDKLSAVGCDDKSVKWFNSYLSNV